MWLKIVGGSAPASHSLSVSNADRRDLASEMAIEEAKKRSKHLPLAIGGLAVEPCGHTLGTAARQADRSRIRFVLPLHLVARFPSGPEEGPAPHLADTGFLLDQLVIELSAGARRNLDNLH